MAHLGASGRMRADTLLDVLDAGYLAKYVDSPAFPQMSGIMIAKPPGNMGTTFIKAAATMHSDVMIASDLTLPSFKVMRDDFTGGRYTGLALLEMDKLYSRQQSTAMNMEGLIKGLVEEGWSGFATEDMRTIGPETRAHVQGTMTLSLLRKNNERWLDNGFARRFLWITYTLAEPWRIKDAVHEWKLIEMGTINSRRPVNRRIPYRMEEKESEMLGGMCREQPGGNATAYVLLKKIFCVLRWKYPIKNGGPDRAMDIMKDLGPALTTKGGKLNL